MKLITTGRTPKSTLLLFNYLEKNPIIEIRKTAEALKLSFNTTANAVKRLMQAGILLQTSSNSRNRTFSYKEYLDLLREGT
jgi:DNA-binding Lrp family transcriptional regulator